MEHLEKCNQYRYFLVSIKHEAKNRLPDKHIVVDMSYRAGQPENDGIDKNKCLDVHIDMRLPKANFLVQIMLKKERAVYFSNWI